MSYAACVFKQISYLTDQDKLRTSFTKFEALRKNILDGFAITLKHNDDGLAFWTEAGIVFGFLLSINKVDNFYKKLVGIIVDQAFPTLKNDEILTKQTALVFDMFYKAHSAYIKNFELLVL